MGDALNLTMKSLFITKSEQEPFFSLSVSNSFITTALQLFLVLELISKHSYKYDVRLPSPAGRYFQLLNSSLRIDYNLLRAKTI